MRKKSSYKLSGTSLDSFSQDIQQNGVSPVENKLRFSLCTYVHFVLAQKHISRNTWIMQANSIMWTDGYLLPGSALSDRKKLQIELIIIYIYIFFLFHSSCLFEFQFFSFLTFSFCFLFFAFVCWQCWSMSFFNFALNVVFSQYI